MKVLVADALPERFHADLVAQGFDVAWQPGLDAATLPDAVALAAPHALVVRSTKVSAAAIAAGAHLQLVIRAGAGTDTIDSAAAAAAGVYVASCPGKNAVAVAELTMGLFLALDRRIPDNVAALRAGRWDKQRLSEADGLMGRTLGLIGLGRVGQEVAVRASAFGMEVVAWSRSLTPAAATRLGLARCGSVDEVMARADVVSVHVALTPQTRGLIGREQLARLRPGASLVNTSRGGIVDEDALAEAVARGHVRAASDVFADEPAAGQAAFAPALARHEGFYGTHHIGASTRQAQEAVADDVLAILTDFRDHGRTPQAVNVWRRPPAAGQLWVRHLDRVGVLAAVLAILRGRGINVQDMDNTIFEGGDAGSARITLSDAPDEAVLAELRAASEDILGVAWLAAPE